MKDHDIVHFYKSEEIFEKAAEIFAREKNVLDELIPNTDIQHVGSCAVPGAVGKFDVDIQIRVSRNEFESARAALENIYKSKHLELWMDEFAIFQNPDFSTDIDYVLTVIGGRYDDFSRTRDFLIANPKKLQEYNEMKMKYEGQPYHVYRTAKGKFLGPNGNTSFLDY